LRSLLTLRIRDARPEDAEAWRAIDLEGTRLEPPTTFTLPDEMSDVATRAERIRSGAAIYLVAEVDGRVVAGASAKRGERAGTRHVAEVAIAVAQERHGQGIGRALMLALEERARAAGVRKLSLGVFPENERALRLYRSLGYEEEGRQRRHFATRGVERDGLLMAKFL